MHDAHLVVLAVAGEGLLPVAEAEVDIGSGFLSSYLLVTTATCAPWFTFHPGKKSSRAPCMVIP